jgi:rhodanese-related sulfurtransferase
MAIRKLAFGLLMLALTACGSAGSAKTDPGASLVDSPAQEISPAEAETAVSKAYSQFVDVRSPEEYSSGHAGRSVNVPLDKLAGELDRFEKSEPVYLICETGGRSQQAAEIFKNAGFKSVLSVKGGTVAWRQADLPMETRSPHGARNDPANVQ